MAGKGRPRTGGIGPHPCLRSRVQVLRHRDGTCAGTLPPTPSPVESPKTAEDASLRVQCTPLGHSLLPMRRAQVPLMQVMVRIQEIVGNGKSGKDKQYQQKYRPDYPRIPRTIARSVIPDYHARVSPFPTHPHHMLAGMAHIRKSTIAGAPDCAIRRNMVPSIVMARCSRSRVRHNLPLEPIPRICRIV